MLASVVDWIRWLIDLFLNLDAHLGTAIEMLGPWIYVLLFVIIFLETGVVVTPFLPGDSLLFAVGTFAGLGLLDIRLAMLVMCTAAILGDAVNYHIGAFIGPRAFRENRRWLNREHLERTHAFYERHGGKAVVLGRFIPIVRTFVPFVAGIGAMTYRKFFFYNVLGAILWTGIFLFLGYAFGNVPVVKENFHYAVVGIIVISVLPIAYEMLKSRKQADKKEQERPATG